MKEGEEMVKEDGEVRRVKKKVTFIQEGSEDVERVGGSQSQKGAVMVSMTGGVVVSVTGGGGVDGSSSELGIAPTPAPPPTPQPQMTSQPESQQPSSKVVPSSSTREALSVKIQQTQDELDAVIRKFNKLDLVSHTPEELEQPRRCYAPLARRRCGGAAHRNRMCGCYKGRRFR